MSISETPKRKETMAVQPTMLPHTTQPSPTPQASQVTGISRGLFPGVTPEQTLVLDEEANYRLRALNVFALTHREGKLEDLDKNLRLEFGDEALTASIHADSIERALQDARKTLTQVRHGLRVKSKDRMKTMPPVGPARSIMSDILTLYHVSTEVVLDASFRRVNGEEGWVLDATIRETLPEGVTARDISPTSIEVFTQRG